MPPLTPAWPFPLTAMEPPPRAITDEPAAVVTFALTRPENATTSGSVSYIVGGIRTVRELAVLDVAQPPPPVR